MHVLLDLYRSLASVSLEEVLPEALSITVRGGVGTIASIERLDHLPENGLHVCISESLCEDLAAQKRSCNALATLVSKQATSMVSLKKSNSPMKKRKYVTSKGSSNLLRASGRVQPEMRGVFVPSSIGLWDVLKYPLLHPSGEVPVLGGANAGTMLQYFPGGRAAQSHLDSVLLRGNTLGGF